jgi:hypothetical protein
LAVVLLPRLYRFNPGGSDAHTHDGPGPGSFFSAITGLTANTTYNVRAYATNSAGTGYGDTLTFTTAESIVKDDFVGAWPGQGVYYRNSDTGRWVLLETSVASQVVAGDLDGDGKKDLIGVFPNDPGVWTKRSSTNTWLRLDAMTPYWIAAGRMRAAGAPVGGEMSFRAPSSAFGLMLKNNFEDLSMFGPHGRNFTFTIEKNARYGIRLDESAQRSINPGPGELGFRPIKDESAPAQKEKK